MFLSLLTQVPLDYVLTDEDIKAFKQTFFIDEKLSLYFGLVLAVLVVISIFIVAYEISEMGDDKA